MSNNTYLSQAEQLKYSITHEEAVLANTVVNNLDTDVGLRAYKQLQDSIDERSGNDAVLYEVASKFSSKYALGRKLKSLY